MKKLTALLLVFILAVSAAACAKIPSPSELMDDALQQLKQTDYAKDSEFADLIASIGEDNAETFTDLLSDFDYEILEETVNDDSATVTVKITTYPFGQMYLEAAQEYILQVFSIAFSNPDITDEELVQILQDILKDKMSTLEKTYTKTVDVDFVLKDEGWELDYTDIYDTKLFDAFMGGMIEALEAFDEY